MKKIASFFTLFLIIIAATIFTQSCTDYLEKPPSVDITVDSVYNNTVNADKALRPIGIRIPFLTIGVIETACMPHYLMSLRTSQRERVSWGGALNWYRGNISINNYITPRELMIKGQRNNGSRIIT